MDNTRIKITPKKPNKLTIRVTDAEFESLRVVADSYGWTLSRLVRNIIDIYIAKGGSFE